MATISIWDGYVSTVDTYVNWITFEGEQIGGLAYTVDGRDVERSFYRVQDGRVVVNEVRYGTWSGVGYAYDQALVYIYDTIDDACENLDVHPHHIDPHRKNVSTTRIDAPNAHTYTLDEYITEFEICTTHPFK